MSEFDINVSFKTGWCALSVTAEGETVEVSTETLRDSFTELVHSVAEICRGWQASSCRWAREVGGGYFIDIGRDPSDHLHLVIHEAASSNEDTTYRDSWSLVRTRAVLVAHIDFGTFIQRFAGALRRIRTVDTDAAGYIPSWGWTYPTAEAEEIERYARRYGYRPAESTAVQPPSA